MIDFVYFLNELKRRVKSGKRQEGVRIISRKDKLRVKHEWSDTSLSVNM
jgi:hypothetical protein